MATDQRLDELMTERVYKQMSDLNEGLSQADETLVSIINHAKGAEINLKVTTNFQELANNINKATDAQNILTSAQEDWMKTTDSANVQLSRWSGSLKDNIQQQLRLKEELNNTNAELKATQAQLDIYGKSAERNAIIIAQLTEKNKQLQVEERQLKVAISELNPVINANIKQNLASAGSMDEMAQRLGRMRDAWRSMAPAEREANKMMLADIAELDAEIKVLDGQIGNFQRNVGNYGGAIQKFGQFFTRDILRFAASTALFSVLGGAMSFVIDKLGILGKETTKAQKAIDKYNKSIEDIGENTYAAAAKEEAATNVLTKIAQNTNETMNVRIRAVDELQRKYPDYFGNLSKEAILTGNIAEATERLNHDLEAKARMQAATDKIEAAAKKEFELIDARKAKVTELQHAQNDLVKAQRESYNAIESGSGNPNAGGEVASSQAQVTQLKYEISQIDKGINDSRAAQKEYAAEAVKNGLEAGNMAIDNDKKFRSPKPHDFTDANLNDEKEYTKLVGIEKERQYEEAAAAQKKISENESKTLAERITAFRYSSQLQQQAIGEKYGAEFDAVQVQLDKISELKKKKSGGGSLTTEETGLIRPEHVQLLEEQQKAIIAQYNKEIADNEDKTQQGIVQFWKKSISERLSNLSQLTNNVKQQENVQQDALLKRLESGKISLKSYNDEKKEISDKFKAQSLQETKELLQEELQEYQGYGADVSEIIQKLNATLESLDDAHTKAELDRIQKIKEGNKELYSDLWELASTTLSSIQTIEDNGFSYKMQQLQLYQQATELNATQEIQAINSVIGGQINKQQELEQVNAQAQAAENQIAAQQKEQDIKKAKFDREAAEAKIEESTAAGVMKIWESYADVPYIAGALTALVVGIGAAELAAASSAPIPSYAGGVESHPGGWALFGEAGPEVIEEPGKLPYLVTAPTLDILAPGTSVTPMDKIVNIAEGSVNQQYLMEAFKMNIDLEKAFREHTQELKAEIRELIFVTMNKKPFVFKGSPKGWSEYVKLSLG